MRLWTPGEPKVGSPDPFFPDVPCGAHARHPGTELPPAYFFQPIGPPVSAGPKLIYLPTGDGALLQWDQYTGSLVNDPGTPRWQCVKTSDDDSHYLAAHSPTGTKRNQSTIENVDFAGWTEHHIVYRAKYVGVAPAIGCSFTFILTTADGEELNVGPLNIRTGAYKLTNAWQDFDAQLNDNGFVGAPASATLELRAAIPAGFAGYLAITYAAIRTVP